MDKDALRSRIRSQGLVDPEVSLQVAEGLRGWLSARIPGTIAAYLAMPDEVEVSDLFEALPGWRWVLPRVEADLSLTFRDRAVLRELHRWGMRQPIASGEVTPLHEIDLILVPGVAFDVSGGRLGRGGGYYDRLLTGRRKDALAIGVTTRSRLVDHVPSVEHDQRVDWLATETGISACSTRT